jgi:hypothetical protein
MDTCMRTSPVLEMMKYIFLRVGWKCITNVGGRVSEIVPEISDIENPFCRVILIYRPVFHIQLRGGHDEEGAVGSDMLVAHGLRAVRMRRR